jgi:hypothetical protein
METDPTDPARSKTTIPSHFAISYSLLLSLVTVITTIPSTEEAFYRRFIAGKLVYLPNGMGGDKIEIPFSSLPNGTFDLSACGTLRKYFRVSIGYKTHTLPGDRRTEVWITPRFLVEQNLDGSADYLRWIFAAFTAPVGSILGISE